VRELAEEAQISLGLAFKVKRVLLDQALLEERDRRLYVKDAKGLLEAWANRYQGPTDRMALYVMKPPAEAERLLAEVCASKGLRCALTDLAGAWRIAPAVRYHQSTAYIEPAEGVASVGNLVQDLRAKRVDSGANLVLQVGPDPFVLYQAREIGGVPVASPLQIYLDLHRQPGRGEDAAQEILEREIAPKW
jgi:hypothetical protein